MIESSIPSLAKLARLARFAEGLAGKPLYVMVPGMLYVRWRGRILLVRAEHEIHAARVDLFRRWGQS